MPCPIMLNFYLRIVLLSTAQKGCLVCSILCSLENLCFILYQVDVIIMLSQNTNNLYENIYSVQHVKKSIDNDLDYDDTFIVILY